MSGFGYANHWYKHYFLKNVFGIEPKVEEKEDRGHSNGGI
jgi:hypothetical protein